MERAPAPPLTAAAWLRLDAIQRGLARVRPARVLEIGAGEGAMGWRLARRYDYLGLEPDPAASATAAGRLASLGRGRVLTATTEQFLAGPSAPFDLVCAFEVLEHLPDDASELSRWRQLLRPAGHILLSVPAHRRRFAAADRAVGHQRRYDRSDLLALLTGTGFQPLLVESWGAGLGHLLEFLRNRLASSPGTLSPAAATARSGRWHQPRGALAGWVLAAAAAPFRVFQHPLRRSGLGIGWVALARRTE